MLNSLYYGVKIRRTPIGRFLIAVFLLTVASSGIQAANIQETNTKLCAFRLEGVISTGDYDKFVQVIHRNLSRFDEYDERTSAICLKSVGGSYDEALKISELMYNRGISTVIEYGSECFSACAIIFMSGVSPDRSFPYRRLSAGGILGFHAPYVSVPDEKYSKEQVEHIAQSMRKAILALVRLSSQKTKLGREFLKKSLIDKVLEKGPQEAFLVKTIFDVARWDIGIEDAEEHFKIEYNRQTAINVCNNFHYSNMDEPVPRNTNLSVRVEEYVSRYSKNEVRFIVEDGRTHDTVCELYPKQFKGETALTFYACSFDYWSGRNFGDCREYKTSTLIGQAKSVPHFFALDPETLLKRFKD
jgi:hypothetical protein